MAHLDPLGDRHGCSGDWEGYYTHDVAVWRDKEFPIAASMVQAGRRIEGTMVDGLTEWTHPLAEATEAIESGPNPQPIPLLRRILREYPWAVCETVLPTFADLRGNVRGADVTFTKTYRGDITSRVRAGDTLLFMGRKAGHAVAYRGKLDWAGDVLEGTWKIRFPGPFGRIVPPRATGRFVLRRRG